VEKVDEAAESNPPDKVERSDTVKVEVAIKLAPVKVPETSALPVTPRVAPGVVVPIPKLP